MMVISNSNQIMEETTVSNENKHEYKYLSGFGAPSLPPTRCTATAFQTTLLVGNALRHARERVSN
jgi:hypothetical protein